MPWLRIDDRVRTHPKIVEAGPDASWFWFCGICYCREHLTDGFIPKGMLASLCPGVGLSVARRLAGTLVQKVLWHEEAGGYRVHDFLDWNPSRASVLAKRQEDKERKERERHKDEMSIPDISRTTRGQNADSARSVRADTSRVGAIARGSGLGSGSDPGSSVLDESAREDSPQLPAKPYGTKPLIEPPGKWKHGEHEGGFCDWMCFPVDLFDQFATRLERHDGLDPQGARAAVRRWAEDLRDAGQVIPTGKMYDFWNAQWQRAHPDSQPVTEGVAGRQARTSQRLSRFVEEG